MSTVTIIPDFTFSRESALPGRLANTGVEEVKLFESTNAGGFNIGAGNCKLQFDFVSNGYFANNTVATLPHPGHIAVVLRLDHYAATALLQIRGTGIVIGNVSQYPNNRGNPKIPSAQIESFYAGVHPTATNDLLPESSWSGTFSDYVKYTVIIDSTVSATGKTFTRYQIKNNNALLFDSGLIDDGNQWIDTTKTGIGFGHVYGNIDQTPWNIEFTNITVTWGEGVALGDSESQGRTPHSDTLDYLGRGLWITSDGIHVFDPDGRNPGLSNALLLPANLNYGTQSLLTEDRSAYRTDFPNYWIGRDPNSRKTLRLSIKKDFVFAVRFRGADVVPAGEHRATIRIASVIGAAVGNQFTISLSDIPGDFSGKLGPGTVTTSTRTPSVSISANRNNFRIVPGEVVYFNIRCDDNIEPESKTIVVSLINNNCLTTEPQSHSPTAVPRIISEQVLSLDRNDTSDHIVAGDRDMSALQSIALTGLLSDLKRYRRMVEESAGPGYYDTVEQSNLPDYAWERPIFNRIFFNQTPLAPSPRDAVRDSTTGTTVVWDGASWRAWP